MHRFSELVYISTEFSLNKLEELESNIIDQFQTSCSTILVKNLQMIQLQKAIIAIGMFSLFESILQDGLSCKKGFEEAKKIIFKLGNIDLHNRFEYFISAINILKHGKGRSYDALITISDLLPFRIKLPNEVFFEEGDISEINTLIVIDDKFVLDCARLIEEISSEIKKIREDYLN